MQSQNTIADLKKTNGQVIRCKAAIAWEPKKPLDVTEIEVQPPKAGEVRLKIFSNALCHTDIYTLDGHDPEGLFPCILGHEATGIVESIGEGVTSVEVGDIVIPCYTPECKERSCVFCSSEKTNLCPKIRATQGKGVMPDGTSRFSKDGKTIYHFMGCSSFSEYTVVAEISCAKINPTADVNKVCVLGCGIATGWGAATNNCKVEPNTSVVVFGLGAVGLAVVQAAKENGARYIVGVDIQRSKFELAKKLGCDECVNPLELKDQSVKDYLLSKEKWGYHYTFDCTGNVKVMRDALELAHRGYGESCVVGVAAAGQEIATRPFQLVTGRNWKGTAFGGWKSRTEVPQLVNKVLRGETTLDPYITHVIKGIDKVNESIDALHSGDCIRAVVVINERETVKAPQLSVYANMRSYGGYVKRLKHWSNTTQCEMSFSIYLPEPAKRGAPLPPVLYFLGGLTCTDENALIKSGFAQFAAKYGIAVVFPDTSPRGVDIEGQDDTFSFGSGAGFYVDATTDKWKKHYNMYSYVTKELPELVHSVFPVDGTKIGITGHSMGGHGALSLFFKNPGMYKSVSAFAPIANPTQTPWGQVAFNGYLGGVEAGKAYDATELVKSYEGPKVPILIDQGTGDKWYNDELKGETFAEACDQAKYPLEFRFQTGYDHGYFFVTTFLEDHFKWHAKQLGL